jgi:hypothetical protein
MNRTFQSNFQDFFNSREEILLKIVILNSAANSAVNPTKHLCRYIPNGVIMAKRTYKIIRNSHTGSFLRNKEVYCDHCFENFGDQFTMEIHRPDNGNLESKCTPPKKIPLTPQRNFSGAVVWRVTF